MVEVKNDFHPTGLADPQLLIECREALDTLTQLTGMGSLYEFQQ